MAGQHDVLLHLVELLRLDGGERILLGFHGAVLQREIDLGEGDRRGVGAAGARHREIGRHVRHADLEALHVGAGLDRLVRRGVTHAVIGHRHDAVAGLVFIALGELLEDVALGVGQQMIGIAEGVGIIGHADRRKALGREARAGNDDVDRAQRKALVDVGFLAELRGRIDVDRIAAAGALADLLRGPHRRGVERLRRLVDMRPFELGLGHAGTGGGHQRGSGRGQYNRQFLQHENFLHCYICFCYSTVSGFWPNRSNSCVSAQPLLAREGAARLPFQNFVQSAPANAPDARAW